MSKASHAAELAPQQVEGPKATLSQLGELIALMDKDKIERGYMQDFLRRRLTRQPRIVPVEPTSENTHIAKVEEIARKHYPDAVNEILEVVAPWCDPHLDLEFQSFEGNYDEPVRYGSPAVKETNRVCEALFWLARVSVHPLFLGKGFEEFGCNTEGESLGNLTHALFNDVFTTYGHLDPGFSEGAGTIIYGNNCPGWGGLYAHINSALKATGAMRYHMIRPCGIEHEGILNSITTALEKAIVLAAKGDKYRLPKVLGFLDYQRSGKPVCRYYAGKAYVLGTKREV